MDAPKTVALYARVSTKDKGQNPETQLIALREYAQNRGYIICGEYVDVGWSGAKERRPQLDRLMNDAKRGSFSIVLVWRFDRFARSVSHLLAALSTFQKLDCDFISLSESVDTSTPMGKMVFTIMGAVAEMERALIRERVKAGVDRARREGRALGRPRKLIDRDYVLSRIEAGDSLGALSRSLGVSRATVRAVRDRGKKADSVGGNKSDAQTELTD